MTAPDPHLAQALDWLIQLEDADDATRARFDAWLAAHPANASAFRHASSLWDSPLLGLAATGLEAQAQHQARQRKRRRWRSFAAAAGLLLAVGVALQGDLLTGCRFEIEAYNRLVSSEDRHEGVRAFNEKRTPDFKGR